MADGGLVQAETGVDRRQCRCRWLHTVQRQAGPEPIPWGTSTQPLPAPAPAPN